MTLRNQDTLLVSVLPMLHPEKYLLNKIAGTSNETERQILEIESLILKGNQYFKQRKYESSLKTFKECRGLIYKILHPEFDIPNFILGPLIPILPLSPMIESSLIDASVQILNLTIPNTVQDGVILVGIKETPIDKKVEAYSITGFRKAVSADEKLELAGNKGVELLEDNKPEMAIRIMETTLENTKKDALKADPSLIAALELNISAAYLKLDKKQEADKHASSALKSFEKSGDSVGKAQALHLSGVIAKRSGNSGLSTQLFKQASKSLPESIDLSMDSSVIKETKALKSIKDMSGDLFTYRMVKGKKKIGFIPVEDKIPLQKRSETWNVGVPVGEKMVSFEVSNEKLISKEKLIEKVYDVRVDLIKAADLRWNIADSSTTTLYLTHLYSFTLPVKIGDSHHEMGQFKQAEDIYILASKYSKLNKNIEATVLWNKLARNAVEWGHSRYKLENFADAIIQYSKIITEENKVPNSFLYTSSALSVPADEAKELILNFSTRPLPNINWEIIINIINAQTYLQQIVQGLDFYGLTLMPIHTFEYLQSVAGSFAQEAIQAEREFINFKSREEMEAATRRDLETAKAMAEAEAQNQYQQYLAAKEAEDAAQKSHELAVKRHTDTITQRNTYRATSWDQIWAQAAAQALGGGEDALWGEISELADKLERGETIKGPGPKLAAAVTLLAGRRTREYELEKMQDNIDQLAIAIDVAKNYWDAAKQRTIAAEIKWQAALQYSQMAETALTAFDDEYFTPDGWGKMAGIMRDISHSYLFRAIRIAKLMERSYNFENDTDLRIIKVEYGHGVANEAPGRDIWLLGADSLLQDINSFTYYAITTKTRKCTRIKDIISLSSNYPAQFEEFKRTGLLSFETDLYEFDRLHPGFYIQRIEAVEIEVIGLLPTDGLNGTLTAGGVTGHRKKDGTVGKRVHQIDTMPLSDFILRNDMFLYGTETGVRGIFQGLGIGSTWQLHLPKRSNNFDFRRIFDFQLIIYYNALYDPVLRGSILSSPPRPGELSLFYNFGLRYDFPDAWYSFYTQGIAEFDFNRFRLPINQKDFKVESVQFRVVTTQGISNENIVIKVTEPKTASGTATTNSDGVISSSMTELSDIIGNEPFGKWKIEVISGPSITENHELKLDRIYNIQMGLKYSFKYVEEVV